MKDDWNSVHPNPNQVGKTVGIDKQCSVNTYSLIHKSDPVQCMPFCLPPAPPPLNKIAL